MRTCYCMLHLCSFDPAVWVAEFAWSALYTYSIQCDVRSLLLYDIYITIMIDLSNSSFQLIIAANLYPAYKIEWMKVDSNMRDYKKTLSA